MSTSTGHVRGTILNESVKKFGKGLAIVLAILLLLYCAWHVLAARWKSDRSATAESTPTQAQAHQYANVGSSARSLNYSAKPNVIKPGEVVKIPIRGRKIRFLSDLDGLLFTLYTKSGRVIKVSDGQGNLVEETPHLTDWGAYKPEYVSFRTTTDAKEWMLDWWH